MLQLFFGLFLDQFSFGGFALVESITNLAAFILTQDILGLREDIFFLFLDVVLVAVAHVFELDEPGR